MDQAYCVQNGDDNAKEGTKILQPTWESEIQIDPYSHGIVNIESDTGLGCAARESTFNGSVYLLDGEDRKSIGVFWGNQQVYATWEVSSEAINYSGPIYYVTTSSLAKCDSPTYGACYQISVGVDNPPMTAKESRKENKR